MVVGAGSVRGRFDSRSNRASSTACRPRPSTSSRCPPVPRRTSAVQSAAGRQLDVLDTTAVRHSFRRRCGEHLAHAGVRRRVRPTCRPRRRARDDHTRRPTASRSRCVWRPTTRSRPTRTHEQRTSEALDGRSVAFRPAGELPPDSPFTVTIGPGTPSAEGPRTSEPRRRTRGGRSARSSSCGRRCDSGNGCEPRTPARHRVQQRTRRRAVLRRPHRGRPGDRRTSRSTCSAASSSCRARPRVAPPTPVALDAELTDVFGQTLGERRLGRLPGRLGASGAHRARHASGSPSIRRPRRSTSRSRRSTTTRSEPEPGPSHPADLEAFRAYQEAQWSDEDAPEPEWPLIVDEIIEIDAGRGRVRRDRDRSVVGVRGGRLPARRAGSTRRGSSRENDDDYWRNRPTIAWVQSTTIGIDAFFDNERLVIWTTDLETGEPIGGLPGRADRRRPHRHHRRGGSRRTRPRRGGRPRAVGQRRRRHVVPPGTVVRRLAGQHPGRRGQVVRLRRSRRLPARRDRTHHRMAPQLRLVGRCPTRAVRRRRERAVHRLGRAGQRARHRHDRPERARRFQRDRSTSPRGPTSGRRGSSSRRSVSDPNEFASTSHPFSIQEFRRPEFEVTASRTSRPDRSTSPSRPRFASTPSTSRAAHSPTPKSTGWSRSAPRRTAPRTGTSTLSGCGHRGGSTAATSPSSAPPRQRSTRASTADPAGQPSTRSSPAGPTPAAPTTCRSTSTGPTSTCRPPSPPRPPSSTSTGRRGRRGPTCSSTRPSTTSASGATGRSSAKAARSGSTRS